MVHKSQAVNRARALVVDDSTTLQRLMDLTLQPLGIDVDFAASGEDALALAKHKHYDKIGRASCRERV